MAAILLTLALTCLIIPVNALVQTTVRAHSQLLGADTPFSFPESFVAGPQGNVYLLDTALASAMLLSSPKETQAAQTN